MDGLSLDFTTASGHYATGAGGVGVVDLAIGQPMVRFFAKAELVPFKSEEAGRPIHRDAIYVHVAFPGERDEIIREATPADRKRYARVFQAFEAGRMELPDGMPLSALFPANPEIVDQLKFMKVHTVEQLAGLSDTAIQGLGMGASEWQARAVRFLDITRDAGRMGQIERRQRDLDAQVVRANEDNVALRDKIALLEAQALRAAQASSLYVPQRDEVAELRARIAELEAERAQPALADTLAQRLAVDDEPQGDAAGELNKTGSGVPGAGKHRR